MKAAFPDHRYRLSADMRSLSLWIAAAMSLGAALACSNSEAPSSTLSLAPTYHLRSIDGVQLPIVDAGGGSIDSGHVLRLGGDTVRIDEDSHVPPSGGFPGQQTIAFGTWRAAQSGNVIVLYPLLANTVDTAFVGNGDTLTLHTDSHIQLYVAP